MKVLRIGIVPMAAIKARAAAAPKGGKPKPGEPDIWFHSAQRMGRLIDDNWLLLHEIRRRPPQSMTELAKRMGHHSANLSQKLKALELRGLVSIERGAIKASKRPVVPYDRIELLIAPFADTA